MSSPWDMDCARPHPRAPSDAHWSSVDAADMVARPPSRPRRKRKGAPESPQTEAAIARWSMSPDTRDALPVGSSPLRWGGVLAPSPEKQVGGAARDSSQGSSVRRESLDRTRHNKGAAVRQPYLVADKLKWLDRVHFEQAPPNQTQRKDAELIRRCLERHDKPFVTGPAGIVNGQARGGKLHCTWAQRLRGWLGAEHSLRELSAKQRREKICQQHKPIGAEFKRAEVILDREANEKATVDNRYVGSRWLSKRMKQLVRDKYNGADFHADHHWRQRFRKRYGYSLRRVSNLKRHSVLERLPNILRWHQKYRMMLSDDTDVLTPDGVRQWDIVFGRFPLTHRWNFDQVPLAVGPGLRHGPYYSKDRHTPCA
jgi:hypothetical protein